LSASSATRREDLTAWDHVERVADARRLVHATLWMLAREVRQSRRSTRTIEDSMDHDSGVVARPKFRIWLRPDGIVQLVWVPRVEMALEDAVAATEAMAELTGGRRSPLLVDTRDIGPLDRSARLEFVRRGDLVSAVALIVDTPLSRMLGNFFLSVSKPMAPTRLFQDEASAVAWLLEFVG